MLNKTLFDNMENNDKQGLAPLRLTSLGDGIFAFAMTLLIISINFPAPQLPNFSVINYVMQEWPNFLNYAIAFLVLAIVWLNYSQQLNHINRTYPLLTFLNICLFLFVVLVPFSVSIYSDYPHNLQAALLFNLNMLIIISLLALIWLYAYKKNLLKPCESEAHLQGLRRHIIFFPAVPIVAIFICFFNPVLANFVYLFIPFTYFCLVPRK